MVTDRRREKLLPVPRWPTREEATRSLLFSPLRIGPVEIRERTWVPAMVPWRATEDGFVTPEVLDWYERFASGPLLRVGHDRYIAGLRKLTETVRRASQGRTKVLIQIIDFLSIRRRPTKEKFFGQ